MFRIMQDPSSGSVKLYLNKITDNGSIVQVVVCVQILAAYSDLYWVCILHWVQHTHTLQVRICRRTLTTHTTNCTIEPLSVIVVKYSLTLPDDGFCMIQNMLE
jgi:hypothetical protein